VLSYRTGAYGAERHALGQRPRRLHEADQRARRRHQRREDHLVEECETGYATDRGVECYERLKGKHGGATAFQPLSTGITFALTEKAPADKIPMITSPATAAANRPTARLQVELPADRHLLDGADMLIQHIAKKEGGWTS
jgi:hypothetical protein